MAKKCSRSQHWRMAACTSCWNFMKQPPRVAWHHGEMLRAHELSANNRLSCPLAPTSNKRRSRCHGPETWKAKYQPACLPRLQHVMKDWPSCSPVVESWRWTGRPFSHTTTTLVSGMSRATQSRDEGKPVLVQRQRVWTRTKHEKTCARRKLQHKRRSDKYHSAHNRVTAWNCRTMQKYRANLNSENWIVD